MPRKPPRDRTAEKAQGMRIARFAGRYRVIAVVLGGKL